MGQLRQRIVCASHVFVFFAMSEIILCSLQVSNGIQVNDGFPLSSVPVQNGDWITHDPYSG
ncbi:MAG: hypothetical protein OXG56_07260 [Gammaproteobacteria bacterium]|nr:hypothetical protein [Gammaproteobacteria bacterium]